MNKLFYPVVIILFSFSSFCLSLVTNFVDKNIAVVGSEISALFSYNSMDYHRKITCELKDSMGNLVDSEIGEFTLEDSESFSSSPMNHFSCDLNHTRRVTVKITSKDITKKLHLFWTTDSSEGQEVKEFVFSFRLPPVSRIAGPTDRRQQSRISSLPASVRSFGNTTASAQIPSETEANNAAPMTVTVLTRRQRCNDWIIDQQWINGKEYGIGKWRRVEISGVEEGAVIEVSLTKISGLQERISLSISQDEDTQAISGDTLTINGATPYFYLRKATGRSGESYKLRIKVGDQELEFTVELKNHHFESERQK